MLVEALMLGGPVQGVLAYFGSLGPDPDPDLFKTLWDALWIPFIREPL